MDRQRKVYRPNFLENLQCRVEQQRRFIEVMLKGLRVKSMLQAEHKMTDILRENMKLKHHKRHVSMRIQKHMSLINRMEKLLGTMEHTIQTTTNDLCQAKEDYSSVKVNHQALEKCYSETCSQYFNCKNDFEAIKHKYDIISSDRTMFQQFFREELVKNRQLQSKYTVLEQHTLCAICKDRKSSILLLPCRHSNFCHSCIQKIRTHSQDEQGEIKCPLCRTPVDRDIHLIL